MADCKKLSIYSQHPSPQGEGTSGNPTASGWGINKMKLTMNRVMVNDSRLILHRGPCTLYLIPLCYDIPAMF
jgi:hypothetical protein